MTLSRRVAVSAFFTVAMAGPCHAQDKNKSKGHHSTPPSSTLLSPAIAAPATGGTVPFAWIDDASLLPAGSVSLGISTLFWHGTDLGEVDAPVVSGAVGLTDRLQVDVSVPHVIGGSDPSGVVGGVGTTFVSAKVGILTGGQAGVRLAVSPTLEILGEGASLSLTPGDSRTYIGLPVSVEVRGRAARLFASAGYFSSGVWFAGGGVGGQASARVAWSAAFSRSLARDASGTVVHDRRDLSGGAAYRLTPRMALFGSVGTTVATADQDGAGSTLSGGILFLLAPTRSAGPHR